MACDALFLKRYHTPVIHFGILHFKNKETLFYSVGPTSRYSRSCHDKMGHIKTNKTLHLTEILTHLKSFNNNIHSTEDKPGQTSSFFRNN